MNRLELLRLRRAALLRSTRLQRADVAIRLNRFEAHPFGALLEGAGALLRRPALRRTAGFAIAFGLKSLLRRGRTAR